MNNTSEQSGGPGRYLRRLEALEAQLTEYKDKCDGLEVRCTSLEQWKYSVEKWLFDNFEFKLDGNQFEVEKVEVVSTIPETPDVYSTPSGQVGINIQPNEATPSSSSAASRNNLSQLNNFSVEDNNLNFSTLSATPCVSSLLTNGHGNEEGQNDGTQSEKSIILKTETSELDNESLITFRNVRSLFDSDVEIEEEVIPNLAITPRRNSNSQECTTTVEAVSSFMNGDLMEYEDVEVEAVVMPSNRGGLSFVNIAEDDEEQLREPTSVALTPTVTMTLQKKIEKVIPVMNGNGSISTPQIPIVAQKNLTEVSFIKKATPDNSRASRSPTRSNGFTPFKTPEKLKISNIQSTNQIIGNGKTHKIAKSQKTPLSPYRGTAAVKVHRGRRSPSVVGHRNILDQSESHDLEDDTPCDVCNGREPELGNEMVFCDTCNICVHQACYGIKPIPQGKWLCNPCRQGLNPKEIQCRFCPTFGGALKPVQSPAKTHWAHVSCTLWIPEVNLGSKTTMEPVVNVHKIPKERWNLKCNICNQKKGACIQCQFNKKCVKAFHVTCARKEGLEMQQILDDTLSQGCTLTAFCKNHSYGRTDQKPHKNKPKRISSKSPKKKRRVELNQSLSLPVQIKDPLE